MKKANAKAVPDSPKLIAAFSSGFEAVANRLGLILFPVILDLFFWLGPHLRLKRLITGAVEQVFALAEDGAAEAAPETAAVMQDSRLAMLDMAERLNLFAFLRSFPVGIPSLMASRLPVETPLEGPVMWEVPSFPVSVLLWLGLTVAGLVLGTLYFSVVKQAVLNDKVDWRAALVQWPWASVQVLSLALFWTALLLGLSIPASCLITLFSFSGLTISSLGMILYSLMLLWILYPLLFSPHGIFVGGMRMWASVKAGMRLSRQTATSTFLFIVLAFILSAGLDYVWSMPAAGSWMAAVGILGHAFIATSLLAASFIYYKEAARYLQRVEQQVKFSSA